MTIVFPRSCSSACAVFYTVFVFTTLKVDGTQLKTLLVTRVVTNVIASVASVFRQCNSSHLTRTIVIIALPLSIVFLRSSSANEYYTTASMAALLHDADAFKPITSTATARITFRTTSLADDISVDNSLSFFDKLQK